MQPSNSLLAQALVLAAQKHDGQHDKGEAPYILHPLRVMLSLGQEASEEMRVVALLHDVIEDTPVTSGTLRARGFPETVIEAVEALTKREDEKADYMKAIRRVAGNPVARRVKIADLTDNLDGSRIANPTPKDQVRLEKYRAARQFLLESENPKS